MNVFNVRLLALSLLLTLNMYAFANDKVGNAVAVIGTATVVRADDGAEEVLIKNSELYLNDKIITGADGLVKVLLRDDSILKMSPSSELVISAVIAGPGAEGKSTVDLLKGRLRSVIGTSLGTNTEFDVNTPVAIAGVRGTDFEVVHVLVGGQWVTAVRVFNGAVEFADEAGRSRAVILLPQQYSLATAAEGLSANKDIADSESLLEVLGVDGLEGSDELIDLSKLDEALDAEQIEQVLFELNTELDIDIDAIFKRAAPTATPTQTNSVGSELSDTQLDIITEPVSRESGISFDVNIPVPNQ